VALAMIRDRAKAQLWPLYRNKPLDWLPDVLMDNPEPHRWPRAAGLGTGRLALYVGYAALGWGWYGWWRLAALNAGVSVGCDCLSSERPRPP
jgi:hypothetical protein